MPANPSKTPPIVSGIAIGFSAAIFVLVAIGIVSHRSLSQFIANSKSESHAYQILATINALRADVKDAESDTRGYVITGDRHYLEIYQNALNAIGPRLQTLTKLIESDPMQRRRVVVLGPLIEQKLRVMREKQIRRSLGFEIAIQTPLVVEGERLMEEVDRGLREMETEENGLLTSRLKETEINGARAIRLITCGAAMALFLLMLAGWMVSRDLAGRNRAEAAVRASDKMFRGLLESAPDAMVIVNEKGGIEFFNAQAEKMFGYTADELRGQPIELIIPQRFRPTHVEKRDSYFAAPVVRGMGVGRDLFGVRKDGTEIPVEISLSPLRTPMGLRVSSAIRDVSRQKQEAEELRNLNHALQARTSQLEVANNELESFSYSVSHDLRAPLRSLDGFSQALLDDNEGKLDAESADNLRRVRAASQRMGHLIDDLLNLARVSRTEINRENVDLSKMAREVAEELRAGAVNSRAQVSIAEGLIGQGDPRLLRVVLTNLLSNAWKFTASRPSPRIEFGVSVNNGHAEYFVRDNGVGFDMKYVGKLFGAFQRLHSMTEFPGTGIGLATVQRIVQRHGGRVWADGEVEVGATFYFTLAPMAQGIALARAA